ncbi:lipoprotein [Sandaracinobacteroides hominis]|uniref:lipoprotein n=1 Tax=Sandaracinobacteroides hominis TaxID=2780086 RepID=UPI0018F59745|nr:lipoprotein [Sandaracinobacteroides hominis]
MGLRLALLAGTLLLAGCGYKGPVTRLEPPDPALTKEQQKGARAVEKERVAAGLTVPAEARPIRVDDLTVRLEVRRDDPFSLPPEGTETVRPVPFPGDKAPPAEKWTQQRDEEQPN